MRGGVGSLGHFLAIVGGDSIVEGSGLIERAEWVSVSSNQGSSAGKGSGGGIVVEDGGEISGGI